MVGVGASAEEGLQASHDLSTDEPRLADELGQEPPRWDDLETLRGALRSATADERAEAVLAAGRLGDAGRLLGSELVRLLEDPAPNVRRAAHEALERIGVEPSWFVPVVREVLQDDHFDVVDARRTLERKGFDPAAVAEILAEALSAPDHAIRRNAALMLLRLRPVAGPVRSALERVAEHDADPIVRDYAREALDRMAEQSHD